MRESAPSLGTPPRLLANECVLRAMLDVLVKLDPAALHLVFDQAHERLTRIGPVAPQEADFFTSAHAAIDTIMQVPSAADISAGRAVAAQETAGAEAEQSGEGSPREAA